MHLIRRRGSWLAAIVAALALALPGAAAAQTVTGTIQGTVVDTNGNVLPGVTILVKHVETGAERTLVTNDSGIYSAPYVAIGGYTITATLSGFGPVTRAGITVGLNDTKVVDFKLDPRLTDSVTVTADAPRINTTNAEVKGSLTSEQIMDKPTSSPGSFLGLAETFTGFQENPTSGQNNPTASSGSSVNFNGTGTRGATFQINGVNNDDSSENQNRQGAALSTIKEFQVLKSSYSAEFGRGDGAVVLVQTKSGTNTLHGDGYWYKQDNDKWNAKSFFAPTTPKPVRTRDQYGFTAGFPIVQNTLFAFANVDRTSLEGQNNYTRDLILASDAAAGTLTRGNDTPANRAWIQSVLDRFPSSLTPNDPRSNRTYAGLQQIDWPDEDYSGRLDWNMRDSSTLTGRYQYTHQTRETEDIVIGENAKQNNEQQNLGITWTRVFGSSLVMEGRYGLGVRSTNVNIADGNDTPIIRFTASPVSGSIIGNAGNYPINRDQTDHQFVFNMTKQVLSRHSVKAGADIRRQALDDTADNFSRGFWTFNRTCGGVTYATPYAAFFDGCVQRYQKAYGPFFLENRMNESNVYVQDDWRVRDTLTLNLGLRYEYVAAPKEVENRIDYIYGADTDNIEPRLGVAYAPKWDQGFLGKLSGGAGNLSIRGGWGIYDGRIFQSVFSQGGASVRFNPPNALDRVISDQLNLSDPSNGFVFVPGPQTSRVSIAIPDKDLEMPATTKMNVSVQRAMPFQSTLTISYERNHNDKRIRFAQGNLPLSPLDGPITVVNHPFNAPTGTFPDLRGKVINAIAADVACAGTGFYNLAVTAACPNVVPIADNEISARVPRTNERRPDPLYGTNTLISNDAESWYDGVEFEWIKRESHGLSFQAAYTFSKSVDTTSEPTAVGVGDSNANGPNAKYAKGLARYHTPHRFTLNGSYRLPFYSNRNDLVGQVLGGWQISGVLKLVHGTPFGVTDTTAGRPDLEFDGYSEVRPVILDRSILGNTVSNPSTSVQQLPRAAFRPGTYTDTVDDLVPRNAFYSDGVRNVDLAASKVFKMPWNGHSMAVRIEAFNAFNRVQFGIPTVDIASTSFGRILGGSNIYSPRAIQLVLRYRY